MSEIKQSNNKALTSLILGVLAILIPIIGIVLGILGLIFASNSKKEMLQSGDSGMNLALTGKVCSIIGIIINSILILILLVIFYFAVNTGISTY